MSYTQTMKWGRKHPRGHRLNIIMSTGSGFWPSIAWLDDEWWPYVNFCTAHGVKPMPAEEWYKRGLGTLGRCCQQLEMQRIEAATENRA